jgi:small redox-active disulfide protein 2
MKIEILGAGCAKCKSLERNVREAAKELALNAEIVKVQDINEIIGYGVMSTPALVIDGEVRLAGKLASVEEIKILLTK